MISIIVGFIILIIVVCLVNGIVHFMDLKKQLGIKELEKKELKKSLEEANSKLNRREAFRLGVPDEGCAFEFLHFGDETLAGLTHRKGIGKIQDISAKGLRLICDYDLPLKKTILIQIEFELNKEPFTLQAHLIRKEAHISQPFITYGLIFVEMIPTDQERLVYCINQRVLKQANPTTSAI
ncbi:PilZ domain-containing protein [Paenibacillus peoriae]|uniref:PilZ domain-containing protein n=1 Tax=Paenibacillus peoriae TaxID=59893 RepID=UPI00026C5A42|nr:PilZ domain-containing protein [Paenibacillus peoriae]MEC0181229.1 PilZ domain-containing protein [Paenibacillus peoriae]